MTRAAAARDSMAWWLKVSPAMQTTTKGAARKAPSKSSPRAQASSPPEAHRGGGRGPFMSARLPSREEEQQLARRYRDGRDPDIARTLIENHLRLVMTIARQCGSR